MLLLRATSCPAALLLALATAHAATPATSAADASDPLAASLAAPLSAPSDYSFAPPPSTALPPDPVVPGAASGVHTVVTAGAGNRGAGGSVAMESALPGTDGRTHVFLQGGGGEETLWKHGPTATTRDVSGGFSTLLPGDAGSLTVMVGSAQTNWGRR